jgi:transcription elongation GreA/GreB family factor
VARTGQFGDFSENAEYQAAKGRLRHILFRMEQLTDMLKRATLIATESHSRVQLGSRVTVKSEDGKEKTFMLTGPAEADPMHGRLSHLSPLGMALLGQAVGNQVAVDTPNGRITYTIISLA